MELIGKVTEIIYFNDKNSYAVFLFRTEEKSIMCVGYVPYIKIGDKLQLIGNYTEHKVYGKQFKIETFEKVVPTDEEELLEYLSSGFIKGIGKTIAKRIIKQFGAGSFEVLKNEPEKLSTIRGISETKAIEIQKAVNDEWAFLQLSKYLKPYGIGASNINNVYKVWGANSINVINENPYYLVDVLYGVEFSFIDKIASDLDFDKTDMKRIKSGVKYCLLNSTYNGNTCAKMENLVDAVCKFLNVDNILVENSIIELINDKDLVLENREDTKYVYLYKMYKSEEFIASKIYEFAVQKEKECNIDKRIEKIEKLQNIELSELQKQAVNMAYKNQLSIITGGPGTGKTTIIKCLIKLFEDEDLDIALCAPTGRAAKRMTELTGVEAKTIHRLLEINKIENELDKFNANITPIDKDVLIIDEVSMMDNILFDYVMHGINNNIKLILVGDADQLPSVGPGEILNNLINSGIVKHIYLDEIFRQAKESAIIVNAHKINNGEYPNLDLKDKDFFFMKSDDQQVVLNTIIELCEKRLNGFNNIDNVKDIQIICPSKRGDVGTKNMNKCLQYALNPKSEYKAEKTFGQTVYRVGDKVMQTKNNYDIQWEKDGYIGEGIFNGDLGYITRINNSEGEIEVLFDDGKKVIYTNSVLEELEHSYAITIHKSQGSEFPVVIMPIVKGPKMLYTRNLLYTGVTRAKKMIILVGDETEIKNMVDNVNQKERTTGLEYKLSRICFGG
ncbi:MAG: ATP-dependent RecD-like DNA helicase [Clostridiales bacterium]|nr:ATP-dependent RecD-like DNA helicase [Clostridiales bacterium]